MKFIAGLRVWVNGPLGKTPQVFPRFSGSANRRVDLFLPLIASILPGGDEQKSMVARWPTASEEWPVAGEAGGREPAGSAGVSPLHRSDDLDSPGDAQM